MPIKDKEKRKEYQRELMRKRRTNGLTKNNVSPNNFVSPSPISPVSPMLDPNSNVSPQMLDLGLTVRPEEKKLDPVRPLESVKPCSRCPEIENSISNFANLYRQEQEKNKEQKQLNYQQEKQEKELELKIISLQETNQILGKDISYWQETDLENKYKQTINELASKINQWEQKYTKLENQNKNTSNYLTISDLNNLISKHQKIQTIQHRYSDKDIKEREFLKSLLDKLWTFN